MPDLDAEMDNDPALKVRPDLDLDALDRAIARMMPDNGHVLMRHVPLPDNDEYGDSGNDWYCERCKQDWWMRQQPGRPEPTKPCRRFRPTRDPRDSHEAWEWAVGEYGIKSWGATVGEPKGLILFSGELRDGRHFGATVGANELTARALAIRALGKETE